MLDAVARESALLARLDHVTAERVAQAAVGLRDSLRGDVVEAREERALASDSIEHRDQLIEDALPMLAGGRIPGERVALIGIGGLPDGMVASVRQAVEVG